MKAIYPIPLLLTTLLAACGGGSWRHQPWQRQPAAPPATGMSLLAGDSGGFGNLDGSGDQARLSAPAGLALGADGNLYIADRQNRTIRKMTPQGQLSTVASGFNDPASVVADRAGNLYVWDIGTASIRKVSPGGQVSEFAALPGQDPFSFMPLAQLAIDAGGTLYAADPHNREIVRISSSGQVFKLAVTDGAPSAVAVDDSGNVYFNDRFALQRLSPAGTLSTLAGRKDESGSVDGHGSAARFGAISAIAVAANGDLLVTDKGMSRVRRVSADGKVSTIGGPNLASVSHPERDLVAPDGVVAAANGTIYVSDSGNNVIRAIKADGAMTVVAGKALAGWSYDAEPGRKFYSLSGIAFDKAGTAYLADTLGALYKMDAQGATTRIATKGDLNYISHLVAQDDGALHVANGDTVYKVAPDGQVVPLNPYPRPPAEAAIIGISGLAVDGKGGVYTAAGSGMHNIAANGAISHLFSMPFKPEGGLAWDGNGNFYVSGNCENGPREGVDSHAQPSRINCSVYKLAANGSASTLLDGRTSSVKLRQPVRLALDPASGNLYVADRIAGASFTRPDRGPQVFRITPQGQVSTVVGSAALRGFKAGALPASLPDFVTGMAVRGSSLYLTTPATALKINTLP